MTAHELARKLLAGPDEVVVGGDLDCYGSKLTEISELSLRNHDDHEDGTVCVVSKDEPSGWSHMTKNLAFVLLE